MELNLTAWLKRVRLEIDPFLPKGYRANQRKAATVADSGREDDLSSDMPSSQDILNTITECLLYTEIDRQNEKSITDGE